MRAVFFGSSRVDAWSLMESSVVHIAGVCRVDYKR